MKHRFVWASALALAATITSQVQTMAGVIMISTRKNVDSSWGTDALDGGKGPGMTTPGDVAMATLLGDHGYTTRIILEVLLGPGGAGYPMGGNPDDFLYPTDLNMAIGLVIWSGSSSSADIPPPPFGIPLMMGEHVTLGDNAARQGSIFMYYNGGDSTDPNESNGASKYMKVIAPDHPIMKGIPLDDQGLSLIHI